MTDRSGFAEQIAPNTVQRSNYAWYVVFVLLLVGIVSQLDRSILSLLVDPIKTDLGLSDTQAGVLQGTAFALFFVAFSMPCGMLVDRVHRPKVLALGVAVWSVMTALGGLATGFWSLFAARAGVGMSEAILAPAAFSLIADYFPASSRGRAMSTYNMANYLGGGASLLVGGLILGALGGTSVILPLVGSMHDWQVTLLLVGLPGLFASLLVLTVREPTRSNPQPARNTSKEKFIDHMRQAPRVYFAVHAVSALTAFTGIGVVSWLPSYFVRQFALTPAHVGAMLGPVSALAGVLGCLSSGLCSDWLVSRQRLGGRFLLPLAWWPLALFGLCGLVFASDPRIALVGVFVFLFGSGFGLASVGPTIQDITPGQFRGQAAALHFVLAGLLAFGSAPALVGLISEKYFKGQASLGQAMVVLMVPIILTGFTVCASTLRAYHHRRIAFASAPVSKS